MTAIKPICHNTSAVKLRLDFDSWFEADLHHKVENVIVLQNSPQIKPNIWDTVVSKFVA